ncbi:MAG: capsular biosynthesis protein [Candidatus Cloacimonetes bacterium]|nr:capsular biosynthesis protein [Candidatus Cloacimonadota bacterium]MDD3235304.1 capsular biosynthesis protein [Candidatus Cloacimonadota bacterium]
MIDIHSHILPSIDDGSQDIEDSLAQLATMKAGGIKRVYLTSHYFRGHYQYERSEYDLKFEALKAKAKAANICMELYPGFEIFLQPDILIDIQKHSLTMGDSPYILIESELNGLPNDFYSNIYPLLRAGYKPILAHAERYVSIMKKPSIAESLTHRNIYIQTNAGSLLGHYGEKVMKTAWTLVNNGWTHFIASDDHVRGNYGAFFEARGLINERVDHYTADLLCRINPASIASGEAIAYQYVDVHHPRPRRRNWFKRLFA